MKKLNKKINIIDIFIIISVILILGSVVVREIAVSKFEDKNYIENTKITFRLVNIDEAVFNEIEKGDHIFFNENDSGASIGIVNSKLKQSVTGEQISDSNGFGEITEYKVEIISECLKNSSGFYMINNRVISPGKIIYADNGFVGFECEIVSIESVE